MYIVMKNAIRDNERVKSQSRYGGPMDTTTMILEDAPVYSYNSVPVEDGFWNRLQKGLKYIFHDSSSQPIPSSSFNNRNNTVGATNSYTLNNRYGTVGSTNPYSFNNHNNAIGTTDANAFTNRYNTPYTASTQQPYGVNTRPMDMYSQPANDPLQTPSKYVFDSIPIVDLMRLIEAIPITQIYESQTKTSPYRVAPNCDLFLLVRCFLSNKSFFHTQDKPQNLSLP